MERRSSLEVLIVSACCAMCAVVAGCSPDSVQTSRESDQSRVEAILDPQITAYGFEPQLNSFDGQGGTFFAGDGWAPPGEDAGGSFAWAMDSQASLWFSPADSGDALEFRALCRALPFDGAPVQRVTVRVGGQVCGSAEIGSHWQEIAVSMPDGVVDIGLNRMDLEFEWSRKPADVGINQDNRELSAAFRWVAVGATDSFESVGESRGAAMLDRESSLLTLAPGDDVAIPVPVGSRFQAHLEGAPQMTGSADIELFFGYPGNVREEQWRDRVGSTWSRDFAVENPGLRIGYFGIRNASHEGVDASGAVPVTLNWRPENFRISPLREASPRTRPHVFLYLVDTVRVDSLALFGGARPTTPELEAFSHDAVMFTNAVTASTWTLPSVVSILTGVYPFRHGVMQGDVKLSPESPHRTLASILGETGYDTVAISQSFVAGPKFGIDTGFRRFFFNNQLNGIRLRSADVRRVLTQWLSHDHDWERPVLGYVHTVGPHAPYRPTGRFRRFADANPGNLSEQDYSPAKFISEGHGSLPEEVEHLRALYEGEIEYADAEFGRFLDALKFFDLYEDSIVIFVSDHGEEFADHGGFDHGRTVYEEVARVPLLVKLPGRRTTGGITVDERVSTVDIFASIVEMTEARPAQTVIDGRELPFENLKSGDTSPELRTVFSELDVVPNEIYQAVNYRALWVGSAKCIESLGGIDRFGDWEPRLQAFDTETDGRELSPLPEDDPRYTLCKEMVAGWALVIGDHADRPSDTQLASEEAREMLRSLGYIQ